MGVLVEAGELTRFSRQALTELPATPRYFSEVLRHASDTIRGTTLLLFVMSAFLGASIVNFAFFFLRSIGASDYLGAISGYGDTRLGAVVMFGYVFVSKVCCGMVAEIGAMSINEEIDALESTGVDPMRYVVGTRLLGVLIFLPIGSAVALLGCTAGGYVDAVVVLHGISSHALLELHWGVQSFADQIYAFVAHLAITLATTLAACFYGMRTRGGPANVGDSVARSLVVNLVVLHVLAAFFAVLFYGTNLRLPIGG
jgi:phospholipid/cholesterol/gamma-HCH transport system permease protein